MIHYNMRYRGAYEYEKFLLNYLQYSNMANDLSAEVNNTQSYETLKQLHDTITELYHKSTSAYGNSERCYKKLIMFKEAK